MWKLTDRTQQNANEMEPQYSDAIQALNITHDDARDALKRIAVMWALMHIIIQTQEDGGFDWWLNPVE